MIINFFPMLAYVLVSTFTPGPSNISSASIAVLRGYKNTLPYQAGLAAGVFLMMAASGWVSTALLSTFPILEPVLRYVGAGYILYLALGILKASYTFTAQNTKPLGFVHGLTLQVLNPKLLIYAFTLFSAFLAPLANNGALVVLAATLLAATSFGATSAWAIGGTAIGTYLHNARVKSMINILLALALVYTAVSLTGIL